MNSANIKLTRIEVYLTPLVRSSSDDRCPRKPSHLHVACLCHLRLPSVKAELDSGLF